MDGNKDEALRCISIAEAAIASGDKARALKFIRIAKRLDYNLPLDDLLAACENLGSPSTSSHEEKSAVTHSPGANKKSKEQMPHENVSSSNEDRSYTKEHVQLIREIKSNKDYYAILGLEKTCSVEEIKRAYRKLSLKVHPDKNQAPGSEEAFKIVSKAFKCLSSEESRRRYDQTGPVEEFELSEQHSMRRRRRTGHGFYEENFDPDEIFRSFFFGSQANVFHTAPMYRTRGMASEQRTNAHSGAFNFVTLLQILPILIIFLFVFLPFSEPDYSLQKNYSYQIPKVTEKYEVEFYVKSPNFDQDFPPGSSSRAGLEDHVMRDYRTILTRFCHMELQRRLWARGSPTPHCDKLQKIGVA